MQQPQEDKEQPQDKKQPQEDKEQPQDKKQTQEDKFSPWQILNRLIDFVRQLQQPKGKKLPFQLIHRFIALVRITHRSESVKKSRFTDDELVIISHLEQAATDLRVANPELIAQAKQILSESPFVPEVRNYKRYLLACVELLLIEATQRQKNPAVYDFLFNDGELWYFHNRGKLRKEVVREIELYLASGSPYWTLEEEQELDKYFEEVVAYHMTRALSVDEFILEKIQQMPDYERNDFLYSRNVKDWIVKWHDEYCKFHAHVSKRSFENRVYEVKKEERKREYQKKGIEEEELKKAQKRSLT
jgi:hypothetical protein